MATREDVARLQALIESMNLPIEVESIDDERSNGIDRSVLIAGSIAGERGAWVEIPRDLYDKLMFHASVIAAFSPPET